MASKMAGSRISAETSELRQLFNPVYHPFMSNMNGTIKHLIVFR